MPAQTTVKGRAPSHMLPGIPTAPCAHGGWPQELHGISVRMYGSSNSRTSKTEKSVRRAVADHGMDIHIIIAKGQCRMAPEQVADCRQCLSGNTCTGELLKGSVAEEAAPWEGSLTDADLKTDFMEET